MLTQFYVGVLVSIVEDWLLGEIQGTAGGAEPLCRPSAAGPCAWRRAPAVPGRSRGGASSGTGPLCRTCFQIKRLRVPRETRSLFPAVQLSVGRSLLRIVKPEISLVLVSGGLQPGVAVQMANHPAGIHLEARRHCLGMQAPAGDGGEAVVHALEYLVPTKLAPKPSGRSNLK